MVPDQRLPRPSPTTHQQLRNSPRPHQGSAQHPVAGVILTSADLDHVLGLLLMREFTPVRIYATCPVISILKKQLLPDARPSPRTIPLDRD
ncbi:MBL fold metallo-hydrolase [Tunturiibacter gelidiferens]|uniref:MBL fold metallo-hydrolase n=1 Tax=Tunturiibacter gelidiferens TaxID=3069689 RepID=UPI003D9AF5AC